MDLDKKIFRLVKLSFSPTGLRHGRKEEEHSVGQIEFSHTLAEILNDPTVDFSIVHFESTEEDVTPANHNCRLIRYPTRYGIEVLGDVNKNGRTRLYRFYLSDAPEKYSVVMSLLFSVEAGDREGDSLKACEIRRALWRRLNSMDDAELREAVSFESSEPVIEDM
jgi:hypothetical protein